MGTVKFSGSDGHDGAGVTVDTNIKGLAPAGPFHGVHIYAGHNPAGPGGCIAPTFASAGGHLRYPANSAAAVTLTNDTGNSGDRIGCGIIK
jgi:Cu/Zn superoxide dismutase